MLPVPPEAVTEVVTPIGAHLVSVFLICAAIMIMVIIAVSNWR